MESRLGYKLQSGTVEPEITPFENRNHFGIQKAKQEGKFFIGFATNSGRVAGEDLEKMSDICKKYNVEGILLTPTQNFIVYGVNNEDAQALADEFGSIRLSL
jgi:sulfite reductase (ferredoxin)